MPITISLDDLAGFDVTSTSPSSHSRASTTSSSSSSSDRSRTRSFASSSSMQPLPSPLRQSTGPPLRLNKFREGLMEYPAEIDFGDEDDDDDRAGDTLKASSGFKGIKLASEDSVSTIQTKLPSIKSPGGLIVANERLVGNGKVRKLVVAPKKDKLQVKIDKERQKGIERGLEELFDEEDEVPKSKVKLTLKPRAPIRTALEDLDALDWGDEDEDQATLKVTDAMKAQLPPPKTSTIRSLQDDPVVVPAPPPDSYEDDFADLTDANLGSFQKKLAAPKRMSLASNLDTSSTTDEWDSPPARSSTRRSGWNDNGYDSSKRHSETSATSITSISTPRDNNSLELYEDDDAEFGLVVNDDFGSDRQNLISRLDAKRKAYDTIPKGVSHLIHHRRAGTDETNSTADASMEDGLVFENAPRELSKRQLDKSRRKRANGQKIDSLGRSKEQQLEWEHIRERGWGRSTPLPPMRDRIQRPPAVMPVGSHRSQSASKLQILKDADDLKRRSDSPGGIKASRSSLSSIHAQPPPPSHSSIPLQGPTTPSHSRALRSQRSQMLLPTESPSLGLSRKQSMPTLSEDFRPTLSPIDSFGTAEPRNSNTTSRLTRPTQSSLSKRVTRSRLPVQALFETNERDIPDSSSISSISTNASARIQTESKYGSQGQSGGSTFIGKGGSLTKKDRARSYGNDNLDLDGLQLDDSPPRASSVAGSSAKRSTMDPKLNKTLPKDKMRAEQPSNKGSWGRTKGKKTKSTKLTLLRREDMSRAEYDTTEVQRNSGMTFNIEKGRWEGNEAFSGDFDRVELPAVRPALITQDSISDALGGKLGVGPASASSWIVGDMKFDPQQMRWISTLDPADEEPDPFAEMWGEEDDEFGAGDTIRLSKFGIPGRGPFASTHSSMGSSRMPSEASSSMSWHDQSFSSNHTQVERFNVQLETISADLREECREAERRHREEMRPWIVKPERDPEGREMQWRNGKRLWEIRTLTRGA